MSGIRSGKPGYHGGTQTEVGGFITVAGRAGLALVPTVAAWASSGGPFNGQDFAVLAEEFLQRVRAAGPVEGVLLALHGAWVSENDDDPDGWLLQQVREIVGPTVPIVVTLDLHANITTRMIAAADALVGFRTYPHIDMYETGVRAAELLVTIMRQHLHPKMVLCKIPLLVPPENAQTTDGPMADLMAEAIQLHTQPEYLSVSLFPVQPWIDVEEVGCSALIVTTGAPDEAQQQVNALGEHFWRRRLDFSVPWPAR